MDAVLLHYTIILLSIRAKTYFSRETSMVFIRFMYINAPIKGKRTKTPGHNLLIFCQGYYVRQF